MPLSNIVFGYDDGSERFKTTTGEHLGKTKSCLRDYGLAYFQESVNPDNHSVHWNLGHDKPSYSTTNFQENPWNTKIVSDKALIEKQKAKLRKSHVNFGQDEVDYDWKRNQTDIEEINGFTKRHAESDPVGAARRRAQEKNIIWGYDKPVLSSLAKSSFTDPATRLSDAAGHRNLELQRRKHIKEFISTLKKSSVSFGQDEVTYKTTNNHPDPREVPDADKYKSGLIRPDNKSSIVFGYNTLDYSTTSKTGYQK